MPKIADNLTVTLLDKEGDIQLAHHHMKTPFIMSNRSIIIAYYMMEGEDESFHFSWSSRGNENLADTYSK